MVSCLVAKVCPVSYQTHWQIVVAVVDIVVSSRVRPPFHVFLSCRILYSKKTIPTCSRSACISLAVNIFNLSCFDKFT
ncbi:hypothetical protein SUGI_0279670 [Cryptomeria japonica]|nr:hypothetical protein SUGI_0279670 [Cryptomeria japonica]